MTDVELFVQVAVKTLINLGLAVAGTIMVVLLVALICYLLSE